MNSFPSWLQDKRENWIAVGIANTTAAAGVSSTTSDALGTSLGFICGALGLACFVAAAVDGPHIRKQSHSCSWLWGWT